MPTRQLAGMTVFQLAAAPPVRQRPTDLAAIAVTGGDLPFLALVTSDPILGVSDLKHGVPPFVGPVKLR